MRKHDFLPYEKAIEAMAREYAKVKPIKPLDNLKSKNYEHIPDFNSFKLLENIYCYNLEILMLLKQLRQKIIKPELIELVENLYILKTNITDKLEKIYNDIAGKYPASPVVSRYNLPTLLRRLLYLDSYIINNIESLSNNYNRLNNIKEKEYKASLLLDNIILIITSL